MTLDREKRQNQVLEEIIRVHISSALPVGSSYIAKTLNLSPATIRNVMFELERKGLVKQPYTSAGRVPTDLGYRKYVNDMMSVRELEAEDLFSKIERYAHKKKIVEEILEAASHAVSEMTNYTGLALSPSNKLYFDGTYHMLEQPEFMELEMARDFLRVIEERSELAHLMNKDIEAEQTIIRIGRENAFNELRECTIITSTYRFKNQPSGNIGVIGPMRMQYEEIVPMVEYLAELTTKTLEGIL